MRYAKTFALLPALFAAAAVPARAQLVITPTYTSAILTDPNSAGIISTISSAIQMYQSTYTNPVNVTIQFDEMNSGLGQSSTYYVPIGYSSYVSHLKATKPGSPLLTYVPNSTNPVNGASSVYVNTANARAIGFTGANVPTGATDSAISLNTSITNITRTGTQDPGHYDLLAVVEHEMDEALGISSALNGLNSGDPSPTNHITPEDLFRFSASGTRSFTTSSSATSYFSIDNGATNIVGFNQSGGGADYQDWVSSGTHRVQDAFGYPGQQPNFGTAEDTALQAIGYNRVAVVAPEPSPVAALGIGVLGIGLLVCKARRRSPMKH